MVVIDGFEQPVQQSLTAKATGLQHTPKTTLFVLTEIQTPGGSTVWVPQAPKEEKPFVGQVFQNLQQAYLYYVRYGLSGGFGVRKSTQKRLNDINKTICEKHYVCSKAGYPEKIQKDTLVEEEEVEKPKRSSNIKITGCKARITLKLIPGSTTNFKITVFEETHNHMMCRQEHKHMLRKARQLSYPEQHFIFKLGMLNIGPTKAHNILKGLKGSYESVNGMVIDFKNFRRDINAHIGSSDAQMIVNKMKSTKSYVRDFSFEYQLNNSKLDAMFWADEVAKANYREFGDIVSFDATYRTNKYNMVFVPFTGIDNHRKCVTLGAGLISNETMDSYKWLLRAFVKTFEVQPRIIVTDQDKSMKAAVAEVLTESTHRLCMWHITQKLQTKI